MTTANSSGFLIRPYRRADRPFVREICAETCWMGEKDLRRIPDEWIWAEFWTRYFTDIEPANTFIVERPADGCVCGYLTGTVDLRRHEHYMWRLLPGIIAHVIRRRLMRRRQSRQAIFAMLKSMLRNETAVPAALLRRYPATFHENLLPCARGRGLGRKLLQVWIQKLASLGISGVHAQILSMNTAMQKLLEGEGFRAVASSRIRAWEHIDPQPVEALTCVREI